MIGVLAFGVGNVSSIVSMLRRLSVPVTVISTPDQMDACDAFILPGVGAFDDVVSRFADSGLAEPLGDLVHGAGRPVLGICVGMQMLAEGSDEGELPGLGWVPGRVRHLGERLGPEVRLPVMGWHYTTPVEGRHVVGNSAERQRFYYVHSYFFDAAEDGDVAARVDYGTDILLPAAVERGVISGTQFHPEKSHRFGMRLLQSFADRVTSA